MRRRRDDPRPADVHPAICREHSDRTAFLLLVACAALINSDQNLLAPNMSACADEFGFTKQEKDEKLGGTLAAGLFLAGAPAAIAVGAAADGAMRRVDLLALILLIGSFGCLGSALARSFWQLFAARALTGVSLGGGLPVTFSLMGDMFDASERAVQSGRLGVAMGAGQMLGQALAGATGPAFGWRAPFYMVSGAMLLLTIAISRTMREPPRDRSAGARAATAEEQEPLQPARAPEASAPALPRAPVAGWAALFRTPTVWLLLLQVLVGEPSLAHHDFHHRHHLPHPSQHRLQLHLHLHLHHLLHLPPPLPPWLLQGIPGCVPWGCIAAFVPDYLHAEQRFSVREATAVMTAFSLGGIAGQLAGGQLGRRPGGKRGPGPRLSAASVRCVLRRRH